jgi:hypothetical protein
MKLLRIFLAILVTGMVIGAGNLAAQVETYSYIFTADPETGITAFNGSTITIQGAAASHTLIDWNLMGTFGGPLDPANSFVDPAGTNISSYDATTWTGFFQVDATGSSLVFNGTNNTGAGTTLFPGTLDNQFADPAGVWSPLVRSVPDSGSTVVLFGCAIGLLTLLNELNRRRVRHS